MCPLCIGTAWLIASGVSSAGGAATVAWHSVTKRRRRKAHGVGWGKRSEPQQTQDVVAPSEFAALTPTCGETPCPSPAPSTPLPPQT